MDNFVMEPVLLFFKFHTSSVQNDKQFVVINIGANFKAAESSPKVFPLVYQPPSRSTILISTL